MIKYYEKNFGSNKGSRNNVVDVLNNYVVGDVEVVIPPVEPSILLDAVIDQSQKDFVLVDENIVFDFTTDIITNTVTDENVTLYYNQTPVVVPFGAPVPFIFVYGSKELRFKLEEDGLYITRFGTFTEEISIVLSEGIEETILMGENVNKLKVCYLNFLELLANDNVSGIYADAIGYEQAYFEITEYR